MWEKTSHSVQNIYFMSKTDKNTILNEILRSKNTVFTFKELSLKFPKIKDVNLRKQISYYCKQGDLIRLRRGIYSKDKNFDPYELASKIYTPSYISFETVLRNEGVIFQNYKTIDIASQVSRVLKIMGIRIKYIKMPDRILINNLGLIQKNFYTIANKERAFTDILYKNKNYYLDNENKIDKNLIKEYKKIYAK